MAQVILSDANKEALLADPNFAVAVKWSILAQAAYTRGQDGTNLVSAASAKQFAQWRPLAAHLIAQPSIIDQTAYYFFIDQIVLQGLICWNSTSNLTSDAIAWLYANNHFGANDLAQAWFAQQVYQSLW